MSESIQSSWDNFLGKVFSPSGSDQLGADLEAVKEYVRSWATLNLKPLIQPEQISAASLRETASRAAAEAQSLRDMLGTYSPTNAVEENYRRVAEIVAETKEANATRLNQLASNADVRVLSNSERFATALHLAKELGAVAGLFDMAIKGTDAISGTGSWDQVGETSLGVLAGLGAGLLIGVTVSGIPVLIALTVAIGGGYLASKGAEAFIWPLLKEASSHIPSEFWDGLFGMVDGVGAAVSSFFRTATTTRPVPIYRDPLAIDLDGDGIETVGIGSSPVTFDHDADGVRTGSGWVSGDDAWLVFDRNGNGSIDSGRELFGVDSVRDNIALADPGSPLDAVVQAAQLAGAHEFISELPEGYDTLVGEYGATLSGGQRQRIAIARALITNPRILILDEATSALDYESERIVQQNMRRIAQGRTVIIVAHRLSAVRDAHRIVVMERGQIVEAGAHAELLSRPEGRYAALWRMQQV